MPPPPRPLPVLLQRPYIAALVAELEGMAAEQDPPRWLRLWAETEFPECCQPAAR